MTTRLTLDISDSLNSLLDKLCILTGSSKSAILREAIVFQGWAVGHAAKGLAIAAVDEERKVYKEVSMTFLDAAKREHDDAQ